MSESQRTERASNNNNLKPIYTRTIVNSFSSGTVSPFLSAYAVRGLNATASEMGWFQSIANLAPNMMQIPWGTLSDKIGKRVPFIVIGGLITAVLWIPMMFVTSASQLIIMIAAQSILGSMWVPAWTALIGELVHSSKRGITTASINRSATIGSLAATLVSGYWMITVQGTEKQMFFAPFLAAALFGFVSSLVMLFVKEKPHPDNTSSSLILSLKNITEQVRENRNFMRFTVANLVFGFFMAISWPLFSITLAGKELLNASMLEIALVSVIQGAVTIVLQPWGGRLVDRVGRKPLIILYRLGLVLVPIFYGLSTYVYRLYLGGMNLGVLLLYLGSIIFGVLFAFGDVAMFAYLLDITRDQSRGTLTAFFNLVVGIVYFIGSLAGGYLAGFLTDIFGLVIGLELVYALSAVGRTVGALTFKSLEEPHKYPSTLRKELREIVQKLPLMPERGQTQP